MNIYSKTLRRGKEGLGLWVSVSRTLSVSLFINTLIFAEDKPPGRASVMPTFRMSSMVAKRKNKVQFVSNKSMPENLKNLKPKNNLTRFVKTSKTPKNKLRGSTSDIQKAMLHTR